jgi:hypothetical protein
LWNRDISNNLWNLSNPKFLKKKGKKISIFMSLPFYFRFQMSFYSIGKALWYKALQSRLNSSPCLISEFRSSRSLAWFTKIVADMARIWNLQILWKQRVCSIFWCLLDPESFFGKSELVKVTDASEIFYFPVLNTSMISLSVPGLRYTSTIFVGCKLTVGLDSCWVFDWILFQRLWKLGTWL